VEEIPNLVTIADLLFEKVRSPHGIARIRNHGVRMCLDRMKKGNWVSAEELRRLGSFKSVTTMINTMMMYGDQLDILGVEIAQQGIQSGKGRLRLRSTKK
jgi:hypothetical protein